MHDHRKFKVGVNGRIGRTARLFECLRRYVTSNPASPATPAAGNAYNVGGLRVPHFSPILGEVGHPSIHDS